ncbi:PAS domain S-box protein [Methylorubrum populi]
MTSCALGLDVASIISADLFAVKQIAAIPAMLEIICRSTGLGFAAVARVTDETWIACRVQDEIGRGIRSGDMLRTETTLCGEVRHHGKPIVIDDVCADETYRDHPAPVRYGYRSYISFPILWPNGDAFGTLCAVGLQPAKLNTPSIRGMFRQFAALIGLHLDAHGKLAVPEEPSRDEAEAKPHNAPLATLIEHLPLGAGLFGPDGRGLVVNSSLRRFLTQARPHAAADAQLRWPGFEGEGTALVPPDDPLARALRGETVVAARLSNRTDEARAGWVRVSALPVRGNSGAGRQSAPASREDLAVILVVEEEATKRAQDALRQSEARLQAAIDLAGLSPYSWDLERGILHWDARLKAMWGLTPEAVVDRTTWLSAIHPEDRSEVEEAIARCHDPSGDGIYHVEYRVIGIADGVERWISSHGRALFEEGRPTGFTGVALDITERKRAEASLRESEERFRRFAEHSTNVLWLADIENRRVDYISRAFQHVWGRAPEELSSIDDWLETIHPDDRDSASRTVERVGAGELVVLEYRILRPGDGGVRRIRDTFFPIRSDDGRIRRIGGIAEDITGHTSARIYLIAEDGPPRQTLVALLQPAGYEVQTFENAAGLSEIAASLRPGCVVLDSEAEGSDSLTIVRSLKARRLDLPVLVLGSSHGDVGVGVRAMKAGAVDYLEKPWQPPALLTAIAAALADLRTDAERSRAHDETRARIAALSAREREVLEGLLAGGTNKTIGRALGLSPRTVEIHRSHVMEILGARTLPEAVLMAAEAGVRPTDTL